MTSHREWSCSTDLNTVNSLVRELYTHAVCPLTFSNSSSSQFPERESSGNINKMICGQPNPVRFNLWICSLLEELALFLAQIWAQSGSQHKFEREGPGGDQGTEKVGFQSKEFMIKRSLALSPKIWVLEWEVVCDLLSPIFRFKHWWNLWLAILLWFCVTFLWVIFWHSLRL